MVHITIYAGGKGDPPKNEGDTLTRKTTRGDRQYRAGFNDKGNLVWIPVRTKPKRVVQNPRGPRGEYANTVEGAREKAMAYYQKKTTTPRFSIAKDQERQSKYVVTDINKYQPARNDYLGFDDNPGGKVSARSDKMKAWHAAKKGGPRTPIRKGTPSRAVPMEEGTPEFVPIGTVITTPKRTGRKQQRAFLQTTNKRTKKKT